MVEIRSMSTFFQYLYTTIILFLRVYMYIYIHIIHDFHDKRSVSVFLGYPEDTLILDLFQVFFYRLYHGIHYHPTTIWENMVGFFFPSIDHANQHLKYFGELSPRSLGRWSKLTTVIFFKWLKLKPEPSHYSHRLVYHYNWPVEGWARNLQVVIRKGIPFENR